MLYLPFTVHTFEAVNQGSQLASLIVRDYTSDNTVSALVLVGRQAYKYSHENLTFRKQNVPRVGRSHSNTHAIHHVGGSNRLFHYVVLVLVA